MLLRKIWLTVGGGRGGGGEVGGVCVCVLGEGGGVIALELDLQQCE